jgi:hypothetical protein
LCILLLSCAKSTNIDPVDNSFITVQFNGKEVKFDDLLTQPVTNHYTKDSTENLIYLYGTKRADIPKEGEYLEYFIYVVFKLDSTGSMYLVDQTDFNVNVYKDKIKNTTGYSSVLPKSILTFSISPENPEHIRGTLTGTLLNRDYLFSGKEIKDSIAVLSGNFDLNFNAIKHSP